MVSTDLPPHELLTNYVGDSLGRRRTLFGAQLSDDFFPGFLLAITDQLSIYTQMIPYARLQLGHVTMRHGAERSFVIAQLRDRGAPLRLKDATRRWQIDTDGDQPHDLVSAINGRRYWFVDRWLRRLMEPMLCQIADLMIEYYQRQPYAHPTAGMIRLCEDVDATALVVEIDSRVEEGARDTQGRYRVQ